MRRALFSILVSALAVAGMVPISQAGVAEAHFQVTLTILPPQPAPKISQETLTPTSPGYPAHPAFQSQSAAGQEFVVLETEF
ncbi:MAG: hypothetical protein OJF60_001249 [Burkholderiaceae bacterium]|jgi:hypothetical protein|nr:MAG: hypothetical protein OJF60_001249 [Burkholderiaceae bacterium]